MKSLITLVAVLLCSALIQGPSPVAGSRGDGAYEFQVCLSECLGTGCPTTSLTFFGLFPAWSCEDECKYACMWQQEERRRKAGKPVVQYYGKWPFRRMLGIQEPFSTLFSLLNAVPHVRELLWRQDKLAPTRLNPTLRFISISGLFVAINTWIWSTAFHARDTWFTERMDYHFATLHMMFYLWYAVCRLTLHLQPKQVFSVTLWSGLFLGGVFAHHVYFMNFVRFDYGWNMIITGASVVVQFILWMVWALLTLRYPSGASPSKSRAVAKMVIKFQLSLLSFAAFEAFDFPPLFDQLDAHAIWHGLTVALGFYWYQFREADAQLLVAKQSSISV